MQDSKSVMKQVGRGEVEAEDLELGGGGADKHRLRGRKEREGGHWVCS